MTTIAKRERLVEYIRHADDKKIKAIYTMVEDEIKTDENDWSDEFYKELEKRRKVFEKGEAKTFTWEQVKQKAISKLKKKV